MWALNMKKKSLQCTRNSLLQAFVRLWKMDRYELKNVIILILQWKAQSEKKYWVIESDTSFLFQYLM